MVERRVSALVAGVVVLLATAVLWHAFVHSAGPRPRPDAAPPPPPPPAPSPPRADSVAPNRPIKPESAAQIMPASPPPDGGTSGTSYMVLLARAEARRRIRASAGLTYLSDVVAESQDSMLHRWDNRILNPVRVFVEQGRVANFQPAFVEAIQRAFQRWQDAGVPVRFAVSADSTAAEVRFQWRIQFDGERTGQTELQWDGDGHLTSGVVTLATFDPKGQPLAEDDMRVVALHEIGHLIGLDHSPDSTDIMFPVTRVRDLSARDIQTAQLLYQLAPGSLR
jgi:predicted Zn-dependent protease